MKWINIVTHPILVIILFCLTLISGKHIGGVYFLYILLALPHGGIHALFAVGGIVLLLFSYGRYKGSSTYLIEPLLNVLGVFSLYFSLYIFFLRSWDYNESTFEETVPIISHILFMFISFGFLFRSITGFTKVKSHGRNVLT